MAEAKEHILNYTPQELRTYILSNNLKKFRFKQICNWIYNKHVCNFDEMTTLSKKMRERLKSDFAYQLPQTEKQQTSIDGTVKFLLKLKDDDFIEMVLIPMEKKNTLCVSSQVGCARDCAFCATGRLGLKRNLEVYEILGQIMVSLKFLNQRDAKLSNIVFMGMGEPFDNYEDVIKAIKILQDDAAFSFSPRRITISTCGVIPGIHKLSVDGLKTKLAVSLNSAIDEKRNQLMPINKIYPLRDLKRALKEYSYSSTFRITFEYIMIPEFNMSSEDIKAIFKFAGDLSCKINLIPWNPVSGFDFRAPTDKEIELFRSKLMPLNKAVTLRNSRGADIDGACGQLAAQV